MTLKTPDTSPEFFERLYRASADPWDFRNSQYEQARYQAIVANLNDKRYRSAFEPGCAVGELTVRLAPYCQFLEALDCSAAAVKVATDRCRDALRVKIRTGVLPDDIPQQRFDLIVLSEMGYYFSCDALASLISLLWSKLDTGGRLIACHWLGRSEDHRLHGATVHKVISQVTGAYGELSTLNRGFVLQRWSK